MLKFVKDGLRTYLGKCPFSSFIISLSSFSLQNYALLYIMCLNKLKFQTNWVHKNTKTRSCKHEKAAAMFFWERAQYRWMSAIQVNKRKIKIKNSSLGTIWERRRRRVKKQFFFFFSCSPGSRSFTCIALVPKRTWPQLFHVYMILFLIRT